MTYQQTIVVGNLGSDPETRQLPSGTPVTNFSLAVNESWSDRQTGERREKTTWFRVQVFGRQGEIAQQYLSKGRQVMVIGTVEASAYMGNDGQPRASLDLRAQRIQFLQGGDNAGGGRSNYSGGGNNQSGGGNNNNYDDNFTPPPQDVDDIPF